MEALFLSILNRGIAASWLVPAVVLLRLVFRRAPKRMHTALWGLVALRLLMPFSLFSSVSLQPSAEPVPAGIALSPAPAVSTGVGIVDRSVNAALSGSLAPVPAASVNPMQVVLFAASRLWLVGVCVLLGYMLVSYLVLRRKLRFSRETEAGVRVGECVPSPFILGVFFPKIYLPASLSPLETEQILLHERAHIARRDHVLKPAAFVLMSVFWFIPPVWIAYILFCRDVELACDEKVISGCDAAGKALYSKVLVGFSLPHRRLRACPLAFGEVGVKARIRNILNYRKPAFWMILLMTLAILAAAVCFLTDPKPTPAPATAPAPADEPVAVAPETAPPVPQTPQEDSEDAALTEKIREVLSSADTADSAGLFWWQEDMILNSCDAKTGTHTAQTALLQLSYARCDAPLPSSPEPLGVKLAVTERKDMETYREISAYETARDCVLYTDKDGSMWLCAKNGDGTPADVYRLLLNWLGESTSLAVPTPIPHVDGKILIGSDLLQFIDLTACTQTAADGTVSPTPFAGFVASTYDEVRNLDLGAFLTAFPTDGAENRYSRTQVEDALWWYAGLSLADLPETTLEKAELSPEHLTWLAPRESRELPTFRPLLGVAAENLVYLYGDGDLLILRRADESDFTRLLEPGQVINLFALPIYYVQSHRAYAVMQ